MTATLPIALAIDVHATGKSVGTHGVIYRITNSVNGKMYIGQSIRPKMRWAGHRATANGTSIRWPLHMAMLKYGIHNFTFEIVDHAHSADELSSLEIAWITKEKTLAPLGYNLTGGGDGAKAPCPETREKMAAAKRGKKSSASHRAKISKANKGVPKSEAHKASLKGKDYTSRAMSRLGKPRSFATIAKMSAKHKGRQPSPSCRAAQRIAWAVGSRHTEEAKRKISEAGMGRVFSPETRQAISAAGTGKKRSKESRANMSAAQKRRQERNRLAKSVAA